jgi:hypothetical protein
VELAGDKVVWRNADCQNGTLVPGKFLPPGASWVLQPGAVVRPANVLALKCSLHTSCLPVDEPYRRLERSLGAQPLDAAGVSGVPGLPGVPALRLTRQDNLAGLEEYLVFARALVLGSDPACALHLDHASVGPLHALVLWLGQSFWLEPLQANRTTVDGSPVPLNHLVSLRPGMTLRVGAVEVSVSPYQQRYLDF